MFTGSRIIEVLKTALTMLENHVQDVGIGDGTPEENAVALTNIEHARTALDHLFGRRSHGRKHSHGKRDRMARKIFTDVLTQSAVLAIQSSQAPARSIGCSEPKSCTEQDFIADADVIVAKALIVARRAASQWRTQCSETDESDSDPEGFRSEKS